MRNECGSGFSRPEIMWINSVKIAHLLNTIDIRFKYCLQNFTKINPVERMAVH